MPVTDMPDLTIPYWQDYAGLLQLLGMDESSSPDLPTAQVLDEHFSAAIRQSTGRTIRFVAADTLPATAYEDHIYRFGEISTRSNNWHDLFNALVWAQYSNTKAAMNAQHHSELQSGTPINRSPRRDALTLFDECGAVVLSDLDEPLQALAKRDWQGLFCKQRSKWQRHIRIFVVGHALLEKFLHPYKAVTAHVLLFRSEEGFMQAKRPAQRQALDSMLATGLMAGQYLRSTADLSPLPLMGIPGWWSADLQDDNFYADANVFRPPAAGTKSAMINKMEIEL